MKKAVVALATATLVALPSSASAASDRCIPLMVPGVGAVATTTSSGAIRLMVDRDDWGAGKLRYTARAGAWSFRSGRSGAARQSHTIRTPARTVTIKWFVPKTPDPSCTLELT